MKKNLLIIAAIASATLVSCSNEEFGGEEIVPITTEEVPIDFGSYFKAMTRADVTGAEAAALLGNKFVVSGYKGDETKTVGSIVFDNYQVVWDANSAHTSESNTTNWEYAGKDRIKHAIDNGITAQKIKYWDFSQAQYDFIAWSTGSRTPIYEEPANGIPSGSVYVSAITPGTATTTAYTFSGTADDLSQCYIADLVTVKKSAAGTYGEVAGYGENPVQFKFRQLGTKVRIGIYETVPGYSVKDVKFYSAADVALLDENDATNGNNNKVKNGEARIFTTTANQIFKEGKYTISFPTVDSPDKADNNQAHVAFEPKSGASQDTKVEWGALDYTIAEDGEKTAGEVFLGRTSSTASYAGDPDKNYYEIFLPNSDGTNLNLRVNYTLESTDGSGEVITVKGATAQIPSIYTEWKPGFAYTYLFKISDKTNGYTGVYDPTKPDNTSVNSDPAGLYPITFDALVVNAEDGDQTQETITTISTPSITTYQNGSNVVNNNEYTVLTPDATKGITGEIYVTVNDGNTGNTPDLANGHLVTMTENGDGMVNLYQVPAGTTEAVVVDALQIRDDDPSAAGNIVGRNRLELVKTAGQADKLTLTDKVQYGADGNEIALTQGQAAKFMPQSGKTYAFVYFKTIKTTDTPFYQALAFDQFAQGATKYRYDYKNPTTTDAQKDVLYFKEVNGAYTKQTPFIGQGVSNLYLDNQGTTIASGYAVTGTDYYYTDNHGMSYKKAANIAFASFGTATDIYTRTGSGTNADPYVWTQKPTSVTTPADGIAYYQKTTDNNVDVYTYCVILPEQTTGWKELDTDSYVVATETTAVDGQTYFDKYIKNNGVYYTKIIKVQ